MTVHLVLDPLKRHHDTARIPNEQVIPIDVIAVTEFPSSRVYRWHLEATVHSSLMAVPAVARFSSTAITDIATVKGCLDIKVHQPIVGVKVFSNAPHVSVQVTPGDDVRTFKASLSAPARRGQTERAIVYVQPLLPNERKTKPFATTVFFTHVPDVQSEPMFLSFGMIPVGSAETRTVRLTSSTRQPFVLAGPVRWAPNATGTGTTVEGTPNSSAPTCAAVCSVTLHAAAHGDAAGLVDIPISQAGESYSISIPVTAYVR